MESERRPRLRERGELRRKVINDKKKLLVRTPVHAQPRDSAMLSSRDGRHCRWTTAGPWRERTSARRVENGRARRAAQ
jgi:hypothetical protein